MLGTALNVAGILLGGIAGLLRRKSLSLPQESFFKVLLGAFTVFYGLRMTWTSVGGGAAQVLKELAIAVLALIAGKLVGRLLSLQAFSNRIGKRAAEAMAGARSGNQARGGEGFKVCAGLFCAAPLGLLGAIQDGLDGYFYPLAVKAVMDGLATMGLARMFGGQVMLAAVPVLAWQGTITLLCSRWVGPWLEAHRLLVPVNCVGGLLVFSVALVILQIKKIALAEYLPALLFAPLITSLLRFAGASL
jgi:uncharacterized membrane protein YqgA involved in biofilm formation